MNKWMLLLAGLALSSAALAGEDIDRTLDADANGKVLVSNVAGSVVIHGWKSKKVRVTGELGRGTEELVFERDGSNIEIRVEIEGGRHGRYGRVDDTDLEIWLPLDSEIKVVTVSADIEVEDVHGEQHLQSVSGEVDTEIWENDLEIRSISGDATVKGNGKDTLVTINLISGDVEIENVSGEIEAQSVSGDFELELDDINRARVRSTSGDMDISGKMTKGAKLMVETINGDVFIVLDGPVNAEVEIETFNGEIDNCFGPEPIRTSRYAPGRELEFTEGDGNGKIRINTLNGDVSLCTD
jgi:DUF4097 and DUF4098 domain-containing protein YvlB